MHTTPALWILNRHADITLLAHRITLAEVFVSAVRAGRVDHVQQALSELGVEEAQPSSGEPLRLAQLRVRTGLKLPDCCVLDTALSHDAPLATFDAGLAEAARRQGVAVLP